MHFDGSKLLHGSGAGVTLKSPKGDELSCVLQIHFPTTNNIAEYEALLHGLRIAKEIGVQPIMCCGDSDLAAQQVAGTYKARNEVMAAYRDEVDEMTKSFLGYDIKHVRREDNMAADTLSKLGSSRKAVPPGVFLEHLHVPSVKMVDPENPELASSPVMVVLPRNPPWAEPYLQYLMNKKLPEDEVPKRQIERRAKAYTIIDGQLYKRSTSGVFMKCISQVDGIKILREIHEGECGHHAAARSLVAKAFRHGFYWPTAKVDEDHIVELYQGYQMYSKQTHMPATTLHTFPIT
jgi:ribonuclease HI/probable phosphoglycerate mutase